MHDIALPEHAIAHDTALIAALGPRAIVLVGMMGSGKSSIGRRLATRLGIAFVDADSEIEQAAGMTIAEIFERHGEPYFRAGEARVIARLLDQGPQVLATGGGAFMNPDTRAAIRRKGVSVWLKAELDVLMKRIKRRLRLRRAAPPARVLRAAPVLATMPIARQGFVVALGEAGKASRRIGVEF